MRTTTLDESAAADLQTLYSEYEPWKDRSREKVRRLIQNSDIVVGLREHSSNELVASARALTDFEIYAMVYDVIVAKDHRDEGLGERVMDAVTRQPDLNDVFISLQCEESLVPFYEKCGFHLHDKDVKVDNGETLTYRTMLFEEDSER